MPPSTTTAWGNRSTSQTIVGSEAGHAGLDEATVGEGAAHLCGGRHRRVGLRMRGLSQARTGADDQGLGRVLAGGTVTIRGQAPLAELSGYQSRLNAMTAGQGRYTIELSHYEAVPPTVQQQLMSAHKVKDED